MSYKNLKPNYVRMFTLILLFSISIAACSTKQPDQSITDIEWQWAEMSLVPHPENYTLTLSSDGTVSLLNDCNRVSGAYTLDGSSLSFEFGPSTMAFCGEESLDLLYLGFLSSVESYSVVDGQLTLELKEGAGHMTFNQG